ncbi:hypothetical protein [Klebsiella quasivariicola]|uniref:hypothetical protein n=1 Tax=Klebsiella quasivariicola TaxID=2026240 RepID=UPI00247AE701|nr:hypothetical protein [Klebsiella quasivariicola]
MNYNDTELLEQLCKHVEGELTIPGKVYPDYTKWHDKELNTFGGSHMSRLNNGQLQYLRDMEAMRQDEINHDWTAKHYKAIEDKKAITACLESGSLKEMHYPVITRKPSKSKLFNKSLRAI